MSIKGGESEQFKIDSGVRQVYIISSCLFNGRSDLGDKGGDGKEGNEIPGEGERVKTTLPLLCR